MNSQYYQNRRSSFLDNIELYIMEPDDIISHRGLENRSPWSSVQFDPVRQIIKDGKFAAFISKTRGIKRYSIEDKPGFKVLESEIRHERTYDFDQLTSGENLEFDIFIKIPPVKERTARINIKSIEKAKMHVVEPE